MDIQNAILSVAKGAGASVTAAVDALDFGSELEAAHFIGQLAHESGFKPRSENLSYSAKRLRQVWPSRFPHMESTRGYARNPEALANKVYGGRMGNTKPGDGWAFRGRGFIQLTGRSNYTACAKAIGIDLVKNPDHLLDPDVSAKAAFWFFTKNKIWAPAKRNDVNRVTRLINGGLHGIADRRKKTISARAGLSGERPPLSTIRLGSRGSDARLLQQVLVEHGFGPLSLDGIFGRGSVAALKKFQQSRGLAVDGVCGPRTWQILAGRS